MHASKADSYQFISWYAILLFACATSTSVTAAEIFSPGLLKLEVYRDIPGNTVDDLRWDFKYPDSPDEVHFVTRFEVPPSKYVPGNSGGIAVGQRLSGYIVPEQTANYVFYMSAHQAGELWLASDPANSAAIELMTIGTANYPSRSYDTDAPSAPVRLEAGKRYYVEAIMKTSGIGATEDLLAVAWTKEGEAPPSPGAEPISGRFLGILTEADTTPPQAVTDLSVDSSATGMSHLWLNWTAPADPGNTAAAARYDVRYASKSITAANWSEATPADTVFFFPKPAGSSQTLKVGNLNPGTIYYLAVRAQDAAGNFAALSNVAQGMTQAASAGDFEVLWELTFNTPGEDPTAKGDWVHRNPAQTGFNPATQVVDGVLKCQPWNPILDSAPKNDFTEAFVAEFRMRSLTPVAETAGVHDGVVFWVNMDTMDGQHAAMRASVQLMEDNTQRLLIINSDGTAIVTFAGLSTDFQTVRWQFEPVFKSFTLTLNGEAKGSFPYERKAMNDDRYATILAWGGIEAEIDYVRIGRPIRPMNARWQLDFDRAGVDPTAKGDWVHRNPAQTGFDPATQVAGGVLKAQPWNPILDSAPKDDFTYPFIAEFRMRSLTPVAETAGVYEGVVFWINMDTGNGEHAAMTATLQLMEDNTQRLLLINNGTAITNFPGLSSGFHAVRLEFDPPTQTVHTYLDGSDAGTLPYVKKTMNDDRYATILAWGGIEGEFDYVRVGTPIAPIAPAAPALRVTGVGQNLALSWPSAVTGFQLESTVSLSPINWKAVDKPPVVQGDQNVVTDDMAGVATRFYRLRK